MRRLLVPITLAALVATACGGNSGSGGRAASTTSARSGSCDVAVSDTTGQKPTVTIPDGCDPPTSLVSKDIVTGTGQTLTAGQTAIVQYDLYAWSDHKQIDSSWDRGQPFPVTNVGQAAVIDGWNEGLPGMRQGGRRLLIIPPDKGYGPKGADPIKPNETLVFVVDLLQVSG